MIRRFASIGILVFFMVLGGCSGSNQLRGGQKDISYLNKQLDFSINFPRSWEDKYHIEESNDFVKVYHKLIWIKTGEGMLFSITRFKPKEKWVTEGKQLEEMIGLQKIYESDTEVFGFARPTDVQNLSDNESVRAEYVKMEEDVHRVIDSFQKTK